MKHRKLRIVWSVAWGIAAVLLIALWARSYWWADRLYVPLTERNAILIGSMSGQVVIGPSRIGSSQAWRSEKYDEPPPALIRSGLARGKPALIAQEGFWATAKRHPQPIRFGIVRHTFYSPYFVLVGCVSLVSALPWFRWRFTLRTLLIGTTLVAVGLGLILWAVK
jgi:hypothetical protein